jgi:hypothetical protein
MSFLSEIASQNGQRDKMYPDWMNGAIVQYVKLGLDGAIIRAVLMDFNTYFDKIKTDLQNENRLYQTINTIKMEVFDKLYNAGKVFGWTGDISNSNFKHHQGQDYENQKKGYINDISKDVKAHFIKKYGLQDRR